MRPGSSVSSEASWSSGSASALRLLPRLRNPTTPHGLNIVDLQQFLQLRQVPVAHQGQGNTGATHTTGTARSVRVGVVTERRVVVDHVADMGEVESACGHIRGDHQPDLLAAELIEDRRALLLVKPAVHKGQRVECSLEVFEQLGAAVPRITENDGLLDIFLL